MLEVLNKIVNCCYFLCIITLGITHEEPNEVRNVGRVPKITLTLTGIQNIVTCILLSISCHVSYIL